MHVSCISDHNYWITLTFIIIGFWHEHSRPDRDNYIRINWNNIPSHFFHMFQKCSSNVCTSLGLPYDYESIMHFSRTAFAKNRNRPTIERKDNPSKPLGGRLLSSLDVEKIKTLYKCSCTDKYSRCVYWETRGFCKYAWLKQNCKKSCGTC